MNKKICYILFSIVLLAKTSAFCYPPPEHEYFKQPQPKQEKEIDKLLDERLNLTKEQKEYLKTNRQIHKKQMQAKIKKMQRLHDKIRNVYLTGIPPFQANLKTAHLKAQLVLLKQETQKMREQNRKDFEKILTPNQRLELEKLAKEFKQKSNP